MATKGERTREQFLEIAESLILERVFPAPPSTTSSSGPG